MSFNSILTCCVLATIDHQKQGSKYLLASSQQFFLVMGQHQWCIVVLISAKQVFKIYPDFLSCSGNKSNHPGKGLNTNWLSYNKKENSGLMNIQSQSECAISKVLWQNLDQYVYRDFLFVPQQHQEEQLHHRPRQYIFSIILFKANRITHLPLSYSSIPRQNMKIITLELSHTLQYQDSHTLSLLYSSIHHYYDLVLAQHSSKAFKYT